MKELFSKLRFSYIEQVTKEKFLRAITSDQPLFVEPAENARLEAQLAEEKVALKAQKQEVEDLVKQLEASGKELAIRYENIQLQQSRLDALPARILHLEEQIESLQASHPSPSKNTNPDLNLSLAQTQTLLTAREAESADLDAKIRALQSQLPRKQRELERGEGELHPLLNQKKTVVGQAREARQRREEGGVDEMEEKGRWLRASEGVLREVLGLRSE